jgi:transposase-like protein
MGTRVTPSERLRHELDALVGDAGELADPIEEIGRLGARLIIQQALEDELTEFLGRGRYERAETPVAHRNGYERPQKIATTSGPMEIERPRVRDASRLGFESRIVGKGIARTFALETLVICSFLRGLSVRDVEAALEETFDEPVISKSTVSRVLEDTRERYRRWCKRRLDEHDLVYLFLDAIYLKLHPDDTPAEGVLVAWGVTLEGRKVLLGLQLGSRESYEAWLSFGRDLTARGMNAPGLVCADGAPGLWKAVRELWPHTDEQRCTVHALRNVTAKLPERHHTEVKARWWKTFDQASAGRGATRAPGDHRRLPPVVSVSYGSDRARSRRARRAPALAVRAPQADPDHQPPRAHVRRGPPAHQGDRPVPRRDQRTVADLGRARALKPRLARRDHDPEDRGRDRTHPPTAEHIHHPRNRGGRRRLASPPAELRPPTFTRKMGRHPLMRRGYLSRCARLSPCGTHMV